MLNEPELRISMVFVELSVRVLLPLRTTGEEIGVIFPETDRIPLMVLVPDPVKEILAKLPLPITPLVMPPKLTVLSVPGLNVPLFVQFPDTFKVKAPEICKLAPVSRVRFRVIAPTELMTS